MHTSKARFPLPEFMARVHGPSTRVHFLTTKCQVKTTMYRIATLEPVSLYKFFLNFCVSLYTTNLKINSTQVLKFQQR